MIIAIDGPAASGKGTLGKRLARHYGYRHLDTGVIYRAVAKALMDAGADLTDEMLAVSAALELDPDNEPARELLAANFDAWKRAVEAHLRAAGLAEPAEVATFVLTVMEGGVMQARVHRAIDPFDACLRQLQLHLASLPRTAFAPPDAERHRRGPGARAKE